MLVTQSCPRYVKILKYNFNFVNDYIYAAFFLTISFSLHFVFFFPFIFISWRLITLHGIFLVHRLSSCHSQVPEHTSSVVAPWRYLSSSIRDHTHVPCITRWIPNHWTTRKVHMNLFLKL